MQCKHRRWLNWERKTKKKNFQNGCKLAQVSSSVIWHWKVVNMPLTFVPVTTNLPAASWQRAITVSESGAAVRADGTLFCCRPYVLRTHYSKPALNIHTRNTSFSSEPSSSPDTQQTPAHRPPTLTGQHINTWGWSDTCPLNQSLF